MKTLVSLGLVAAVAAVASMPATAAPKQCKAGTVYSKAKGRCINQRAGKPATVQQKAQANCMSWDSQGGVSSRPCAN